MAPALKLISHKLCPYVQRAVIALTEKGVPFERIDIDLANKPDWFLKISPLGKVPVLLVETGDGEVALFESNVICEYIEETQGGAKLHPQDALKRAQHRAWMEFGSTILSELWGLETTGDPAIFETKRCRKVTVNVELSGHLPVREDRDNDFRLGFDRACQVTWIAANVVHNNNLARRGRRATDALIERDAGVRCHCPLEMSEHQHRWFGARFKHVKADPIVFQHFVKQQMRDVVH